MVLVYRRVHTTVHHASGVHTSLLWLRKEVAVASQRVTPKGVALFALFAPCPPMRAPALPPRVAGGGWLTTTEYAH